ncbi:MAG: hypothetical protein GX772_10900 [Alcaligenaceae bacterium]|nr:hypothetical protein [Alcaligenaceae bacterium]
MIVNLFEDITPVESANASRRVFSGVLDSPATTKSYDGSSLTVAGWINPAGSELYQISVEGDFGVVSGYPEKPRPDVADKTGAAPLKGQDRFCGFSMELPFSPEIRINVHFPHGVYHWKTLKSFALDSDLPKHISRLLADGVKSDELTGGSPVSGLLSNAVGFLFRNTRLHRFPALGELPLAAAEQGFFLRFVEFLSDASFSHDVMCVNREGGSAIPGPFAMGESRLLGSVFHQINFLVFDFEGERFYVGQYLHAADFVYFPARNFVFVLPGALYEHAHLHALITGAAQHPDKFAGSSDAVAAVAVNQVVVNGVSPYHFFYDTWPALHVAGRKGGLRHIDRIWAINGHCYLTVELMKARGSSLQAASAAELAQASRGIGFDAMSVVGVSYKALTETEIRYMDQELLQEVAAIPAFSERYAFLNSYELVLWVGISQQKRAWLNQQEALIEVLTSLHEKHPGFCVIFDGMTADIFEASKSADFSADEAVVSSIVRSLPKGIAAYSLVGCGSMEKMHVASKCHFFIANYSTGSMYPARFCRLPGIAHLSNSMLEEVRPIHIHTDTHIVPTDLVVDIPDENCERLDFVSYSIDAGDFSAFVKQVLDSRFQALARA